MTTSTKTPLWLWLLLVFFGGFANLATEIIGPRMFASMYGTATIIWAIIISVTLVGLSVGYSFGGRVPPSQVPRVLFWVLIANAIWLVCVSWLVWLIPAAGGVSFIVITTTATAAFFMPSVLFGMITPMTIAYLSEQVEPEQIAPLAGNLYAVGTVGSVLGALTAAFFWIPYIGLSLSLRIFALILIAFAIIFDRQRRALLVGVVLVVGFFPQPRWEWADTANLTLIAQREGYYQTIRVYAEGDDYLQMNLGPTFHSKIDLRTGEPAYRYAQNIMRLVDDFSPDLTNQRVLVIGGAGHAMAHALERRGASVVEVEIDPVVVQLSDEHFGTIDGEVVVMDGRAYVEQATPNSFDIVIVDAFDGGVGVPPQMTSREFYEAVARILTDEGAMFYNFIGSPEGRLSMSYRAMATTMRPAFGDSGALFTRDDLTDRQNILFVASPSSIAPLELSTLTDDGWILTDDRNPMEMLHEQSREGIYFQR